MIRRFALNALVVLAGAAIIYGITTGFGRQDKLCQVIYTFVAQADAQLGKPGSQGYEIYASLPPKQRRAAIRRGHEESAQLLKKLSYCKPDDLPDRPPTRAERRAEGGDGASTRAQAQQPP